MQVRTYVSVLVRCDRVLNLWYRTLNVRTVLTHLCYYTAKCSLTRQVLINVLDMMREIISA